MTTNQIEALNEGQPQIIPLPLHDRRITYEWFRLQRVEPDFYEKLFASLEERLSSELYCLKCFGRLMRGEALSVKDTKAAAQYLLEHPEVVGKDEIAGAEGAIKC